MSRLMFMDSTIAFAIDMLQPFGPFQNVNVGVAMLRVNQVIASPSDTLNAICSNFPSPPVNALNLCGVDSKSVSLGHQVCCQEA